MDIERARAVVKQVVEGTKRWGKLYTDDRRGVFEFKISDLAEALVLISEHEGGETAQLTADHAAEIAKLNRQMAAASAREKKAQNKLEALREEHEKLQKEYSVVVDALHDVRNELQSRISPTDD